MKGKRSGIKLLIVLLVLLIIFVLGQVFLVGKISKDIKVAPYTGSQIFSEEDINSAMDKTESYFKKNMRGCTMTAIGYGGDTASNNQQESRKKNPGFKYNQVMVINIDFDVRIGSSNFESGTERKDYVIVLARKDDESKWKIQE